MSIYQCTKCKISIISKSAKYCTQCGTRIASPVPAQYLVEGTKERWNIRLIGFWVVWVLGAAALLLNSQSDNITSIVIGVIGFVSGGIFISKSGSIKDSVAILIDSRNR